jgi:hypothetical protein
MAKGQKDKNDQVIVAIFNSYTDADKAITLLKEWDNANDEIKLGAVGTMIKENGKVKTQVGRKTGKGATVGTVLGVTAAVLMAPVGLIGGAVAGAAGGGVVGAFMKQSTHLNKAEIEEIGKELDAGRVAVVVTCDDFEVAPTRDQLIKAGGKVRNYEVPQEAIIEAAQAVPGADAVAVAETPAEVVSEALNAEAEAPAVAEMEEAVAADGAEPTSDAPAEAEQSLDETKA